MSFAPADLALQDQQHTAAYKVSNLRKGAQVTTAVLACWLASGIVFGFAAFKSILVAEGVYYDLCDDQAESAKSLTTGVDDHTPCDKQDMRLNLIFVIASITTNISCLLAGLALDRFGRRACWIASCLFIAIGSLLIGQSFLIPGFDGYVAGNMLLGLGGTFLFVPSFQLANAFPKHSGLVVAIITGAFDASSSVVLFYRMAYEASDGSLSPEIFFFGYIVVPILILVAEVSIMPSHAYHTTAQLEAKIEKASDQTRDIHVSDGDISDSNELIRVRSARSDRRKAKLDKLEEIAGNAEYREARIRAEEERQETSGVWGVLHGMSAHRQILTPWYILIRVTDSTSDASDPTRTLIRKVFEREEPTWILIKPNIEKQWSPLVQTLEGHGDSVYSVAFSPDGKLIASGSEEGTIKIWDTAMGEAQRTLEGHGGHGTAVLSVAFSPDGKLIVSGSGYSGSEEGIIKIWDAGGTIKIWDAATGEAQRTLDRHGDWDAVRSVAFSPDGKLIASGSAEGTIKIWDAATGEAQRTLKGHSAPVRSVAFSPDGKLIASGSGYSGSGGGTVKIWDAATGEAQRTLEGHGGPVRSVFGTEDAIYTQSQSQPQKARRCGYGLSTDNLWITWDGYKTLWLPSEYQPLVSVIRCSVPPSTVTKFAIGCESGRVIVISFLGPPPGFPPS